MNDDAAKSTPARGGSRVKLRSAAVWVAATLAAAFYFFQSSTIAPNHTDEGLLLVLIDAMAHGRRPFFDFAEAYGIFNLIFPVLFFKAFGNEVWGIRMWMLILKLITLGITYQLVHRLTRTEAENPNTPPRGGRFYSAMTAIFMADLIGARWQSQQTPYAFNTVMPMVLGAWYFILCEPLANRRNNVRAAGLLTVVAIWTKLNTGMYLLAGGLYAYFFWIPVDWALSEPGAFRDTAPRRRLFHRSKIIGAIAYAAIFSWFVRRYMNGWFFLYLEVPLLAVTAWTLYDEVTRRRDDPPIARHLRPWVSYLVTSVALSVAVLVGYYGSYAGMYLRELSGILKTIDYTWPFPELGVSAHYIGLNEYYWLQLPWLVTALFIAWTILGRRFGTRAFGAHWALHRGRVTSLFVFLTLHSFVLYARADETHIYQALVLGVPVLFVLLSDFDAFLRAARPTSVPILRLAIAGFGTAYALTLAAMPTLDAFHIDRSDWASPKLKHLRFRQKFNPYVRDASPDVFDYDWDIAESAAGAYVKSLTVPGEEILLLTGNRLLEFDSDTTPVGGRYDFFFYLATVGLLDRAGFEALVPKRVVQSIFRRPPRVIVSAIGNVPLQDVFPELRALRDRLYVKTGGFRHILVYELRLNGKKLDAPMRAPMPYSLR